MRYLLLSLILFLLSFRLNAQTTSVKARFIDETENGVTDCNIKISGKRTGLIYSYFSLAGTAILQKEVSAQKDDSIGISVSHLSYSDTTFYVKVGTTVDLGTVRLSYRQNMLKDVQIKGPPVWKQGDTTNFRADAFKQGDEKKLRDIIRNIPGFVIKEDGSLLFKNKPVTRITIDGQELFADKIKLLLNSFPVHVIDLLQAQENQNENKLLSKLGGNETFLNLTLKKGTFKAAFGDFEAGVGDKGRYMASPVIFSLNKYIKAGYIGNINSLGEGIGWRSLTELKSSAEYEAQDLMLNTPQLKLIQGIPEKYYLKNRLFDNRFEITTQSTKKLNIKTTLALIADKQVQDVYSTFNFFDGDNYTVRSEHTVPVNKPLIINIGQTYTYDIDQYNGLKVKAWWFSDRSQGGTRSSFLENGETDFISNLTKNSWNSFNIQARYTHMTRNHKAFVTTIDFSHQLARQNIKSFSKEWPQIFMLADTAYNGLFQTADHIFSKLNIEQATHVSIGKHKINATLWFKNYKMKLAPGLALSDTLNHIPENRPEAFNERGTYIRNTLSTKLSGEFKFKGARSLYYAVSVGLNQNSIVEETIDRNLVIPELLANVMFNPSLFKSHSDNLIVEYVQSDNSFSRLNTILLPQSVTSFARNSLTNKTLKNLKAEYSLNLNKLTSLTSTNVSISYNRKFNNRVIDGRYLGFLYFSSDSVVSRPTNEFRLSTNNKIPSLLLNAVIELDASLSHVPYLFSYQQTVFEGSNTELLARFALKKNWHQRYYIILSSLYRSVLNKRPALNASSPEQSNRFENFSAGLKQRVLITKDINIVADANLIYNNLGSVNEMRFLLIDAEFNWKIRKSPITLSFKGENLTDRRSYFVAYNGVASQTTSLVPMIGRNFFCAVRCEF